MDWIIKLLNVFKKKEDESFSDSKEMGETIDDAKEMERKTFKASDAIGLVNGHLEKASKIVNDYIIKETNDIESLIKYYSNIGYTDFIFDPCEHFPYSFAPDGMKGIRDHIFETIKKDFENRGFVISKNDYNFPFKISWSKTVEKRADELLR